MLTESSEGLIDKGGYYPMLATIVTSKSKEKENAMAVAWHAIISTNPPAYGVSISPKRFTHKLIVDSGVFAVNFMPGEDAELIAAVGGCSGRDTDKFVTLGIEKERGLVLDVPVLKSAYFALECKLISTTSCADHDWFIGRVVATHWSKEAFDENGMLRFENATPTTYLGSNNYLIVRECQKTHLDRKECIARRTSKSSG